MSEKDEKKAEKAIKKEETRKLREEYSGMKQEAKEGRSELWGDIKEVVDDFLEGVGLKKDPYEKKKKGK